MELKFQFRASLVFIDRWRTYSVGYYVGRDPASFSRLGRGLVRSVGVLGPLELNF